MPIIKVEPTESSRQVSATSSYVSAIRLHFCNGRKERHFKLGVLNSMKDKAEAGRFGIESL